VNDIDIAKIDDGVAVGMRVLRMENMNLMTVPEEGDCL